MEGIGKTTRNLWIAVNNKHINIDEAHQIKISTMHECSYIPNGFYVIFKCFEVKPALEI